jgi:hypothetical protein
MLESGVFDDLAAFRRRRIHSPTIAPADQVERLGSGREGAITREHVLVRERQERAAVAAAPLPAIDELRNAEASPATATCPPP